LAKCDFSQIAAHLERERERRKNRTKEEKQAELEEKKRIQEKYGFAVVNGRKEKIANYMVEPPGLFLGRGEHPKIGRVKKRIMPEDVTINISEDSPVPECPVPGHEWKEVVHNPNVSWLAMWRENIRDSTKYVWLGASSSVKGKADRKKFETARQLKVSFFSSIVFFFKVINFYFRITLMILEQLTMRE
jgi:DNA topoisomerase-1